VSGRAVPAAGALLLLVCGDLDGAPALAETAGAATPTLAARQTPAAAPWSDPSPRPGALLDGLRLTAPASAPAADGEPLLPLPLSPGVQHLPLPQPAPMAPHALSEDPWLVRKWWFWTIVGALAVGTGIVVVVATRGSDEPSTRLGNMEAFR
jgi:hypothetical protein